MIRYFAGHPTAANILMLVFLVAGTVVLPSMKRETLPDVDLFEVQVSVVYPAASAADVEESICQPLEDATDSISFMDEKRCEAKDNLGVMTLKMLQIGDMQQFIDDINTAVDGIDTFPDDTEKPIVQELGRTDRVISIALAAEVSRPELKRLAEDYKQKLLQLDEVSIVNIMGFSTHQLKVEIPDYNLRQYGLGISDIAALIQKQAIDLPAGDIESRQGVHQVRFTEQRRTPAQLAELVVLSGADGAEVRLGDIATISDAFENEEDYITYNGKPATLLQIEKNTIDDSLNVLHAVQAFVDNEKETLPDGMSLHLTQDMTSIVEDRLDMIIKNSWQGIILVILALYLFFSSRYTFWVAMGLPVSFFGSFVVISLLGESINMISLVGLLISIGILMDDAIVISESIASEYQKGKTPLDAAVDGTKRVARGVISSFCTTLMVFTGLMFIQGDIGQVLRVLPVVLLSVLAVSLAEAFLVLPHHLQSSLTKTENETDRTPHWKKLFADWFEVQRERVGQLADRCVEYRYAVVGGAIGFLLLTISMLPSGVLKFKAFPDLDGDVVEARILLPQGTALQRTEAVAAKVIEGLLATDKDLLESEGESLIKSITVQYNKNIDAFETGPHIATVSVDLMSADHRENDIDTITRIWRRHVGDLPDVINVQYKQPAVGPAGRPLQIRLKGDDLEQLSQASYELQNWLKGYPGVVDIMDDLRFGKPQLSVKLLPGVLTSGLTAEAVSIQLRAAYEGLKVDDIQFEEEDFEIQVLLDRASRNSLTDFDYLTINHPKTEQMVPLAAIADIQETRDYARVQRVDNMRTVTVFGEIDSAQANVAQVIGDTKQHFFPQFKERYPNIAIALEGEAKNSAITASSLRQRFLVGAIGIFLLLSLQFRNYLEPIIVMLAIPMAFIGVIWGHLLMGLNLTMPSIMGFVSLAGIVVNNSILLVEFVKIRSREGLSVHEAVSQATRDRFRAIVLTTFTTIAGITPLMFETSLQAQILVPLVTSIGFGVFMSTILILLVLPAMYAILEDFGFTEDGKAE